MAQKKLNFYFKKTVEEISDTEVEDVCLIDPGTDDISHYEEMIKNREEVRKVATIVLNVCGSNYSQCWNYFGSLFIGKNHILPKFRFCKLCFEAKELLLKGFSITTSTSNYMTHLRSCHDLAIKSNNDVKNMTLTKSAITNLSTTTSKFKNARRLAEMCCTDLQPFSIVEKQGFQKYLKQIGIQELPSRSTIATTALNDVFNVYKKAIKEILKSSPENISLVLDMWTDKYKKISYINMKVHYCQHLKMQCISLTTESFPHPHTANAIADKIKNVLSNFEINNKKITAVTDGGANIVAALKISKLVRIGCSAHALHRFLNHDILKQHQFTHLNNIISKLKKIFRSLVFSTEEVLQIQNLEKQDELFKVLIDSQSILDCADADEQFVTAVDKIEEDILNAMTTSSLPTLKNSVETRWNTLLNMTRSFSKNIRTVNIALIKAKKNVLVIEESERQIIEDYCAFLEVFEKATVYLQGKMYPTVSMCIYFYENILRLLDNLEQTTCSKMLADLCIFARKNFYKRFRILKIHVIASLLDPCQKDWATLNKYLRKVPKNVQTPYNYELLHDQDQYYSREMFLLKEIRKIDSSTEKNCESNTLAAPSPKRMKLSETRKQMLEFLEKSTEQNFVDPLETEIKLYFQKQVSDVESLDWWSENKEAFPRVAKLADMCFGIPATSASSEQAFSMAGSCINEKRSRLNPSTAKKQLFVHDNREIVEDFLKM